MYTPKVLRAAGPAEALHPWMFAAEIAELATATGRQLKNIVERARRRRGTPLGEAVRATKNPDDPGAVEAVERYLSGRLNHRPDRQAVHAEALRAGMRVEAFERQDPVLEGHRPWMLEGEIAEYLEGDDLQKRRVLKRVRRRKGTPYGDALLATGMPQDPVSVTFVKRFIADTSNPYKTRAATKEEAVRRGMPVEDAPVPQPWNMKRDAARAKEAQTPKEPPVYLMTDDEITRRAKAGEGDKDRLWREARFRKWTQKQMIEAFE